MSPREEYWRLNENSSNFIKCPKKGICLGGINAEFESEEFYSGICKDGYEGPICNDCSENYGKIDKNTCAKCSEVKYLLWTVFKILTSIFSQVYSLYLGTDLVILLFQILILLF